MSKLSNQKGAAIIMALFVTSLVAIAAAAMLERFSINLRSTELLNRYQQGNLSAQGSIAWAIEQLNNDWRQRKPDQVADWTPIRSPVNRDDNAIISSTIFDAEGRFNLNNLSDVAAQASFIRLVQSAVPQISSETARNLATAVTHWITPGALNNNLDDYYLKSNPPYRAPHRPMVSVSEFRLLKGVTTELFGSLAPYITVLPERTPVNINNAPAPVLMSLSPTLALPAAKTIIAQRRQVPFPSTQSFLQFDVVKNNPIPENQVTVLSNYFLVKTNVKVNQQEVVLYTLLKRMGKNDQPLTTILWQSKGTL